MNKRLSVKTDDRYLKLMEYCPTTGKPCCECCCLESGSKDCETLKPLCSPADENSLTGLVNGGFWVEAPAIHTPMRRRFKERRQFNNDGQGDRGFKKRKHFDRPQNRNFERRETSW